MPVTKAEATGRGSATSLPRKRRLSVGSEPRVEDECGLRRDALCMGKRCFIFICDSSPETCDHSAAALSAIRTFCEENPAALVAPLIRGLEGKPMWTLPRDAVPWLASTSRSEIGVRETADGLAGKGSLLTLLRTIPADFSLLDIVWFHSGFLSTSSPEGVDLYGALRVASQVFGASIRICRQHEPDADLERPKQDHGKVVDEWADVLDAQLTYWPEPFATDRLPLREECTSSSSQPQRLPFARSLVSRGRMIVPQGSSDADAEITICDRLELSLLQEPCSLPPFSTEQTSSNFGKLTAAIPSSPPGAARVQAAPSVSPTSVVAGSEIFFQGVTRRWDDLCLLAPCNVSSIPLFALTGQRYAVGLDDELNRKEGTARFVAAWAACPDLAFVCALRACSSVHAGSSDLAQLVKESSGGGPQRARRKAEEATAEFSLAGTTLFLMHWEDAQCTKAVLTRMALQPDGSGLVQGDKRVLQELMEQATGWQDCVRLGLARVGGAQEGWDTAGQGASVLDLGALLGLEGFARLLRAGTLLPGMPDEPESDRSAGAAECDDKTENVDDEASVLTPRRRSGRGGKGKREEEEDAGSEKDVRGRKTAGSTCVARLASTLPEELAEAMEEVLVREIASVAYASFGTEPESFRKKKRRAFKGKALDCLPGLGFRKGEDPEEVRKKRLLTVQRFCSKSRKGLSAARQRCQELASDLPRDFASQWEAWKEKSTDGGGGQTHALDGERSEADAEERELAVRAAEGAGRTLGVDPCIDATWVEEEAGLEGSPRAWREKSAKGKLRGGERDKHWGPGADRKGAVARGGRSGEDRGEKRQRRAGAGAEGVRAVSGAAEALSGGERLATLEVAQGWGRPGQREAGEAGGDAGVAAGEAGWQAGGRRGPKLKLEPGVLAGEEAQEGVLEPPEQGAVVGEGCPDPVLSAPAPAPPLQAHAAKGHEGSESVAPVSCGSGGQIGGAGDGAGGQDMAQALAATGRAVKVDRDDTTASHRSAGSVGVPAAGRAEAGGGAVAGGVFQTPQKGAGGFLTPEKRGLFSPASEQCFKLNIKRLKEMIRVDLSRPEVLAMIRRESQAAESFFYHCVSCLKDIAKGTYKMRLRREVEDDDLAEVARELREANWDSVLREWKVQEAWEAEVKAEG